LLLNKEEGIMKARKGRISDYSKRTENKIVFWILLNLQGKAFDEFEKEK